MASDASGLSGIATRYATALYELADEQKALDEVAEDLSTVRDLIDESDDLRRLIRSPLFSRADQAKAMAAVLDKAGIGDLVTRFVAVVADNRRLFILAEMIDAYRRILAERRGEVAAEVVSAAELTDEQLNRITDQVREATGGKVAIETRIDPSLIGGLIVRVGSRMVDNSLRTKLQRLQLSMKGAS